MTTPSESAPQISPHLAARGSRGVVILGAAGTGKSTLGDQLADVLGWPVVETEHEAQVLLGTELSEAFIADPAAAQRAVDQAAQDVLERITEEEEPVVAVVSPSAGGTRANLERIKHLKNQGFLVVALDAPTDILARRNGLTAARPVSLGTPRAWFRAQHEQLVGRYAEVDPVWLDTAAMTPNEVAETVLALLGDAKDPVAGSSKLD